MIAMVAPLRDEILPILHMMAVDEHIHLNPAMIYRGTWLNRHLLLAKTGVGAAKMERAMAYILSEFTPSLVILIGFAGGATPNAHVGDLIIADRIIDHDSGQSWETSEIWRSAACNWVEKTGIRHHVGPLVSVSQAIAEPHAKAFLGTTYHAHAIDMEGSAFARLCHRHGVPFLAVRTIFDTMETALPFAAETVGDGGIRPFPLLRHFVRNPRDILKIPHFHYAARRGAAHLEHFARTVVQNQPAS